MHARRAPVLVIASPLALALAAVATPPAAAGSRVREERVLEGRPPLELTADLVLEDRAGEPFDLARLLGKRALLVTWASW